jgi:hypothetical protein
LSSCDELKDILLHQFSIRKHEVYLYCSYSHPFITIFSKRQAQDVMFTVGRFIEGPIELSFNVLGLDVFGSSTNIPYHVKISIEGIP